MARVVIHTNQKLAHQVAWADHLSAGFRARGHDPVVTPDRNKTGDIQVVLGPHYAMREQLGKPYVIRLDRSFYGSTAEWASIGWLLPDEGSDYCNQNSAPDRWHSHVRAGLTDFVPEYRSGGLRVLFGDYGAEISQVRELMRDFDVYRPHPADTRIEGHRGDLLELLDQAGLAAGWRSTALVTAVLRGVRVRCFDERCVAFTARKNRMQWCYDLAHTQWNIEELRAGLFCAQLGVT